MTQMTPNDAAVAEYQKIIEILTRRAVEYSAALAEAQNKNAELKKELDALSSPPAIS